MSIYHTIFPNRHTILPVIHVTTLEQAIRNVRIAQEAGADGCFLINHGMPGWDLIDIYHQVKQDFPDFWIGLNCLDLDPVTMIAEMPPSLQGVWIDNAGIDESADEFSQYVAKEILQAVCSKNGWYGLYFGGVAFKYQRKVQDVASAARLACKYMNVVTTSGPGTGHSASVDKIRTMREAMPPECPLAIASGITPQNVTDYLPYADCFLVATGISQTFDELDSDLTNLLVRTVRGYSG